MQTARKHSDPLPTPPAESAFELSDAWIYRGPGPAAGTDRPTSPALLLREELAMRLGDLVTPGVPRTAAIEAMPGEAKWPIAARIATIVGASGLLWCGIYFVLSAILTG